MRLTIKQSTKRSESHKRSNDACTESFWTLNGQKRLRQGLKQVSVPKSISVAKKKTEEELFWYFLYTDASLDADASIISAFFTMIYKLSYKSFAFTYIVNLIGPFGMNFKFRSIIT